MGDTNSTNSKQEKITAWVARDENGAIYFYSERPLRFDEIGAWNGKVLTFHQIKWEDKEPTKVELAIKICK